MSDLNNIESELRRIRKALVRIADHVDPDGAYEPPQDGKQKAGGMKFI